MTLAVRRLDLSDAPALAQFFQSQPPDYLRYFTPFTFDAERISSILRQAHRDCYLGVWWADDLVAFFMLRGFDDGFEIPSYGVAVDHRFQGRGLARLTLVASKSICRLIGAPRLMLKVHPANVGAHHMYESEGFLQTGHDPVTGQLVYHFDFGGD